MQKTKSLGNVEAGIRGRGRGFERFGPALDRMVKQVKKQLAHHRHRRYEAEIKLTEGASLKKFIVHPEVMRPEVMTSVFLARFLFFNNGLFKGKRALDLGCGCGIQGVVMGLYGAKEVVFSDISKKAIANTKENVARYGLEAKSVAVQSDLFEKVTGKFDVIVFNHPFFADIPLNGEVLGTMSQSKGLIHGFFEEVKPHLAEGAVIVMPYYHLAGPTNNPAVQGPMHGFEVKETFRMTATTGLQRGEISMYELRVKEVSLVVGSSARTPESPFP